MPQNRRRKPYAPVAGCALPAHAAMFHANTHVPEDVTLTPCASAAQPTSVPQDPKVNRKSRAQHPITQPTTESTRHAGARVRAYAVAAAATQPWVRTMQGRAAATTPATEQPPVWHCCRHHSCRAAPKTCVGSGRNNLRVIAHG
eukprot:XP_001703652.1 predicted protein [Chlamydomonas reinhardtii]